MRIHAGVFHDGDTGGGGYQHKRKGDDPAPVDGLQPVSGSVRMRTRTLHRRRMDVDPPTGTFLKTPPSTPF